MVKVDSEFVPGSQFRAFEDWNTSAGPQCSHRVTEVGTRVGSWLARGPYADGSSCLSQICPFFRVVKWASDFPSFSASEFGPT